jgi:hypothetical protein
LIDCCLFAGSHSEQQHLQERPVRQGVWHQRRRQDGTDLWEVSLVCMRVHVHVSFLNYFCCQWTTFGVDSLKDGGNFQRLFPPIHCKVTCLALERRYRYVLQPWRLRFSFIFMNVSMFLTLCKVHLQYSSFPR